MSKLTQEQDKLQDRQIWEAQSLLLLWGWGPTNNRMIYKLAAMLQYAPASAPEGPCSTCGDGGQDMCSRHRPAPVEQPAQASTEPVWLVERMLVAFSQHRHKARQIDGMTAALNVALGEALGPVTADEEEPYRDNRSIELINAFLKSRRSRLPAPVERVTVTFYDAEPTPYWQVSLDGKHIGPRFPVTGYQVDAERYAAGLRAELADQARAAGGTK
jgi:hypothetical protein